VCDAESAFIAWLLTRLPLRRKNIGVLTFKGNNPMIRLGRFEGETSILEVPGWLTKNGRALRFRIKGEGETMLREIIGDGRRESYRDAAIRLGQFKDTDYLFVGNSKTRIKGRTFVGHRALSRLGDNYTARMRSFGIPATLHVARHICAQIALDHEPGAVELVANLLGDSVRTVERHYLADRTSKAADAFDTIIKASIKKAFTMLTEGETDK
jgi:integrase